MKSIIFITLFTLTHLVSQAQENKLDNSDKTQTYALNTITGGVGGSHNFSNSANSFNLGFDYLRRFKPKWEWGIQLDLDWEAGFAHFEGVTMAGIIGYSITSNWPVFGGLGIAPEKGHTEVFGRIGTEYSFYLGKNEHFFLSPGIFADVNLDSVTLSGLIAIGWNW